MDISEAFDPKYGLPIVREKLSYGELLRDIRSKKVKEIHWFSRKDDFYFEGACLVEYHDGKVKQSVVPARDLQIPSAMTANQVKGSLLSPVPTDAELNPAPAVSSDVLNVVGKAFPLIGLVAVYLAVQYMAWLKGDMTDRIKMRQKEQEEAKLQKVEESREMRESEAETLANMGMSVQEIVAELKRADIKYDLYHVKLLVDRAQRQAEQESAVAEAKSQEEEQKKSDKQWHLTFKLVASDDCV